MGKRRIIVLLLLVVIICVMTSCGYRRVIHHDYRYSGESENWRGSFTVDGRTIFYEEKDQLQVKGFSRERLLIEYKGEPIELSNAKEIAYEVSHPLGSIDEHIQYNDPLATREYRFTNSKTKNEPPSFTEDSIINVIVTVDGKQEAFELRNDKTLGFRSIFYGRND